MKKKEKVYTSLGGFESKNHKVKNYKALKPSLVKWIEETTERLLKERNVAELKAGEELKKIIPSVQKQVFFYIHERCYFLDYYYPRKRIAIEIDGGYHRERREIDKQRDKDFKEIGIDTIRIKDKIVLKGGFVDEFNLLVEEVATKRGKTKEAKKKRYEKRLIREAMRRVEQHDKMKHNARWI